MVRKLLGNIRGPQGVPGVKGDKGDPAIEQVFNVMDYGATGDGVTDDSPFFQNCLNDLSEHGGGTFLTPNANYVVSQNLTMPSNIIFEGDNSTILTVLDGEAKTPFNWDRAHDVHIRNLKINGLKEQKDYNKSGGMSGISIRGDSERITIDNCYIYNTLEHAISFGGYVLNNPDRVLRGNDIKITNCTFENNGNPDFPAGARGTGIMTYYGTSNLVVSNCTFKNIAQNFIYLDSGSGSRSELENALPGLSVLNGDFMGSNNQIIGNTFEVTSDFIADNPTAGGTGVVVHAQNKTIISNNVFNFEHGNYFGVQIAGGQEQSPTKQIHINDNIMNVNYIGVRIFQTEKVYIRNNFIQKTDENTESAIEMIYASSPLGWDSADVLKVKDIEINGNTIINPQRIAIRIDNNGVFTDVSNVLIKNNYIETVNQDNQNNRAISVGVSNKLKVIGNQIVGGYYGIWTLSGGQNTKINDNNIEGSLVGILNQSVSTVKNNDTTECVNGITNHNSSSKFLFNEGVRTLNNVASLIHIESDGALHLSTAGASWDYNPLKFGAYYIWVNGLGELRIKYGKPSSGTDGTVIGTA